MITLVSNGNPLAIGQDLIGRVATRTLPGNLRANAVRVFDAGVGGEDISGYLAFVSPSAENLPVGTPGVTGCRTDHLAENDIVQINTRGHVRTVIRHGSPSNALFATDRCNSLCLMCSQPPREVDDSGKAAELIRIISLMDPATKDLGITGGEPTLLGDGLVEVVAACKQFLPQTALHVLSNGRRFWYPSYARKVAAIGHPNLMFGIPVYSDVDSLHDHVVQAKGAFDETLIGLQNLAQAEVPVEIRVVIQRHTAERLPQLAEFIYRNLPFASHVAFMGLEITGFAKGNLEDLWVDPEEYAERLESAVTQLAAAGLNVSVYNHQLCRLPPALWPFCRQSISDWKNEFAPECDRCDVKAACGGFFAWNLGDPRARSVHPVSLAKQP